ncbi:hypothetical protein EDC19_0486 [Natranaerovirga hydrolytica]|uniref:Uncharacterized protein n=1 Tax=Natranaerovirga hydrolytica TaxID=680378 RepID=A0A4R1N520_9FIRM|nr:hypothetical protein [Natranaerovirga hydrolytica]TCK98069.1 hypothetical protein EDC19_0486 [Natranaerovirga hydrolytica]
MWIKIIGLFIIALVSTILLEILVKKDKVEAYGKTYKTIKLLGIFLPFLLICSVYAYYYTDTTIETLMVNSGLYVNILLWVVFYKYWIYKKYNYMLLFLIALSNFSILYIFLTKHMLIHIPITIIIVLLVNLIGYIIREKPNNKVKLIVTCIALIIAFLFSPSKVNPYNKMELKAIEYVENMGYELKDNDKFFISTHNIRRHESTNVWIIRTNIENEYQVERRLLLTYLDGEIIHFDVVE